MVLTEGSTMWHCAPTCTDLMIKPTSPRSCHGGTQHTNTSDRPSICKVVRVVERYDSTFRCRIIEARGSPEVPEVSWRKARSSESISADGAGGDGFISAARSSVIPQ